MRQKLIDANGNRLKVGYIVKVKSDKRTKPHAYKILRLSKKGNLVLVSINSGMGCLLLPNQVIKLELEDLI